MDSRKVPLDLFGNEVPEQFAKAKQLDDLKLNAFASGPSRKSKYERDREAAEQKRKEEEELAAKAYEDFVAAFEADGGGNDRGEGPAAGGRGTSGRAKPKAFVRAGGAPGSSNLYNPLADRAAAAAPPPLTKAAFFGDDDDVPPPPKKPVLPPAAPRAMRPPSPVAAPAAMLGPPPKKLKAGESFLEELKRKDAEREERLASRGAGRGMGAAALAAFESGSYGSRDMGDPLTTNVHVGNLPATITDQALGMFCAKYGPVASLKIMWPRAGNDGSGAGQGMVALRQNKGSGLNGFVAFQRRSDAERACKDLDGFDWGGNLLRTGWGKAMAVAGKPIYGSPSHSCSLKIQHADFRMSGEQSYLVKVDANLRLADVGPDLGPGVEAGVGPRAQETTLCEQIAFKIPLSIPRPRPLQRPRTLFQTFPLHLSLSLPFPILLPLPLSFPLPRRWPKLPAAAEEAFIRTVAEKVKQHGSSFERTLKEREGGNEKFRFLWEEGSDAWVYFRMCLDSRWRVPEKGFDDEGYASIYSTDSAEDSENEYARKGKLGKLGKKRFLAILRALTPRREGIARCMVFALQHADAAEEVVDILCRSLMVDMTPIPRKLARLYVISDILHNSSSPLPNAWKYRQAFQKALPPVFDHLNLIYRSFPGRMKAEGFRKQVGQVLSVWEAFMVFDPVCLEGFGVLLNAKEEVEEAGVEDFDGMELDGEAVEMDVDAEGEGQGPSGGAGFKPSGFMAAFKPATMAPATQDGSGESGTGVGLSAPRIRLK